MASYGSARMIRMDVAELIRPPRRIKPSEAAAEYMKVVGGDGTIRDWSPEATPYMVEPLDCMGGRKYDAVIFVGPARTGKTNALVDGYIAYEVECDPSDGLIIQISEDKAREFSKKRIDRMLNHSPALAKRLSPRGHDNNVHDKIFRAGNYLGIKWPSKNVMASSDFKFVLITDFDRLPEDVGGEGDPFTLASKRTQTFGSTGMTLAESSPGREITDPNWRQPADCPHMAPPTTGILDLYNRGDRRRWYWQCPQKQCREWFQPNRENFNLASKAAFCPHCGAEISQAEKKRLNMAGRWVPEGCSLTAKGEMIGTPKGGRIASFWMEGPAAAFQTWASLAEKLETASETYELTRSEKALKTVTNVDWGLPYLPRAMLDDAARISPADNAEDFERYLVPAQARFLTAAVDVQGGQNARFIVQVHAHGPDREEWLIDRYEIKESNREGLDGNPAPIDPASYPEDWDVITQKVVEATYRTHEEGQELRIRRTIVDSGGEEGVTENAYRWYLKCAQNRLAHRVRVYKGASARNAPLIKESKVPTAAKADVPLLICNPNLLKDAVTNAARRTDNGSSRLHFPRWLGAWFWDEWQSEVRQPDGRWKQVRKRNEALDLAGMNRAAALSLGVAKIRWDKPPAWARPISENSERVSRDERREMQAASKARTKEKAGGFKKASGFKKTDFM